MEEWDIIVLSETWMDEKAWKRIRGRLPEGYRWGVQNAKRKNRKGRAIGGMIMGIREEIMATGEEIEEKGEGMMVGKARIGGRIWRLVGVCVNGDMNNKLERMTGWLEERGGESRTLIGGDFNARTGEGEVERSGRRKEREEGEGDRKMRK